MHEFAEQLLTHVRATWRYRWYAIALAWLFALAGWIVVHRMPDRYEASARVYVDTQTVLRPLLSGLTVQPNVDQMVSMMSRTLISRPNVEKVIQMADVEVGIKTPEDREQLISRLTKEIEVKSAGRENFYTIALADKNPQEALRMVQALLTIFVEGSIGGQRKDSEAARRFIDDQLETYRERLVAAENAVTEFRRRHIGLMASDRQDYYARLSEAESALSRATLELREAENSRDAIKKQLADETAIQSRRRDKSASEGIHPEIDTRIQALEQKLDALRLNYTEQHPDIVAIVRTIAQLKEQRKAEVSSSRITPGAPQTQDLVYQQLTVSLASAEANMAAMRVRVAEYGKRYQELKALANTVPQVDADYTKLTRDYEVTKKNYESLLARRESAQIAGEMETKGGMMDFRVVDPPRVPSVPKAPNRPLLMSLVLLAALGGGVGGAFLINQIRPTINGERRLREMSGLRVLGTVVMVWTDEQKRRRFRGLVAFLLSFLSLLTAYAAIMASLVLAVSRV